MQNFANRKKIILHICTLTQLQQPILGYYKSQYSTKHSYTQCEKEKNHICMQMNDVMSPALSYIKYTPGQLICGVNIYSSSLQAICLSISEQEPANLFFNKGLRLE